MLFFSQVGADEIRPFIFRASFACPYKMVFELRISLIRHCDSFFTCAGLRHRRQGVRDGEV